MGCWRVGKPCMAISVAFVGLDGDSGERRLRRLESAVAWSGWEGQACIRSRMRRLGRVAAGRAAGADAGILSTASRVIGVAADAASRNAMLLAGLMAGVTSMAARGACWSAPSAMRAGRHPPRPAGAAADPAFERAELIGVYVRRSLGAPPPACARRRP